MGKRGFAVRVTDADGNDMYLRRGHRPGRGPIVKFRTRQDAEIAIETFMPGLDDDDVAVVVPYASVPADQFDESQERPFAEAQR